MAIPATSEKTGQQPGRSPEFDRKLARDCNIPEDCSVPNSGELRSKLCRVRLRKGLQLQGKSVACNDVNSL